MTHPAIVLADGCFRDSNGKGAHGLVRGTDRFRILGVVDRTCAGRDAGEVLDGTARGIPIVGDVRAALALGPTHAIVGIATQGGRFTTGLRALILECVNAGLSVVNGLHDAAGEDAEIAAAAAAAGVRLIDLRKPKPKCELHFWSGAVARVAAPRIAVLGTDCALGKRTTTRLLLHALEEQGVRAEMIYTGQTGWMQGARYGLVLDSVPNDFVSGELEHAIVSCDREAAPEVILIEGQSALRNPSGPCGAELLCSGGARGVVLQHAPGRTFYEGFEAQGFRIPPLEDEIDLISRYGARTLAVTLNGAGLAPQAVGEQARALSHHLGVPVVDPLSDGVGALLEPVHRFIDEERAARIQAYSRGQIP